MRNEVVLENRSVVVKVGERTEDVLKRQRNDTPIENDSHTAGNRRGGGGLKLTPNSQAGGETSRP